MKRITFGVLFDGARFAKVRHHRTVVGSRFDASRELRERDDRAVQFLGEALEAARDVREDRRAVFSLADHELQVVDDDEPERSRLIHEAARTVESDVTVMFPVSSM